MFRLLWWLLVGSWYPFKLPVPPPKEGECLYNGVYCKGYQSRHCESGQCRMHCNKNCKCEKTHEFIADALIAKTIK